MQVSFHFEFISTDVYVTVQMHLPSNGEVIGKWYFVPSIFLNFRNKCQLTIIICKFIRNKTVYYTVFSCFIRIAPYEAIFLDLFHFCTEVWPIMFFQSSCKYFCQRCL